MAPGKKRKRAMKGKEDTEKEEVEEVGKSEEGGKGKRKRSCLRMVQNEGRRNTKA